MATSVVCHKKPYTVDIFYKDAGGLLIIRDFRREDIDDVIECVRNSFSEQFEVEGYDPEIWRKMVRRRFSILGRILFGLFKLFDKEPIKFFVADVDGKVVGTVMVAKRGNIGYIETVMVHPNFRQKGIATELMKTAINYVQKRKFIKAILHVLSNNVPAKGLYHKFGFRKFEDIAHLVADADSLSSLTKAERFQVVDFQKSDVDTVYELIKSSREPNSFKVHDFKKNDLKTSLWHRIARMGSVKRMVAVKDEKIVGYASVSYTSAKMAGRITSLEVSPKMVSERIEEELIRVGVNHIRSSGANTVLVTVPLLKGGLIERLSSIGFKKSFVMEGMVLE